VGFPCSEAAISEATVSKATIYEATMKEVVISLADTGKEGALGRVAAKLFFAITKEWGLTDTQRAVLAGVNSRTTLHNWKSKIANDEPIHLGKDTLDRLSYIAGIYKSLQLLFSESTQWAEWVNKPNRDFGGKSAMDRMLAGSVVDLADVRRYLDSWRGEHFA